METNLIALLNPVAALIAGFLASLHCVGMCSPLACLLLTPRKASIPKSYPYVVYHIARLLSYMLIGLLAGVVGARLVEWIGESPSRIFPWIMALFFGLMAFGLDRHFFKHASQGIMGRSVMRRILAMKGEFRALALGFATPLLPCGPLYLFFWVAAASGSGLQGAIVLGSFGLGTVPLMAASFFGWGQLRRKFGSDSIIWIRRAVAAVMVAALVARSFLDLDFVALANGEICQ